MKNAKGNRKILTSNVNIEEKKKVWINTVDKNERGNLKGIDSKNLKNSALSFFKEKNIYNEENLVILNLFCKKNLDDNLVNEEVIEFLQKTFLLYEYFVKGKHERINKREFMDNIYDCCKRIFIKNIIKYEKEILNFLLKNLINFINNYSFFFIYKSLYNLYQYNRKKLTKLCLYKSEPFLFLLNIQCVQISGVPLLINDNAFDPDIVFSFDENDEKDIRDCFFDLERNRAQNGNEKISKEKVIVDVIEVKDSEGEECARGKTSRRGGGKGARLKRIDKGSSATQIATTTVTVIPPIRYSLDQGNCLDREFICLHLCTFFKRCFDNVNFYLIEKFIENYYINQNKENVYKELFLFLFLIYKNKMHNIVDRILIDIMKGVYSTSDIEIQQHKKKKRKVLNDEADSVDEKVCNTDYKFYFEFLVNIITYTNLQYESNYEYYITMLRLLHEEDEFQELYISSFFFVLISSKDVTIRDMLLINFTKYVSKKHNNLDKLFQKIKCIFSLIYDMNCKHVIYNRNTFNTFSTENYIYQDDENEINMKFSYLPFIAEHIFIDSYIHSFLKEIYYIISKSNMYYFSHITNLYLYTYDNIFNKIVNIIYENEMNLNDNSFDICRKIVKPFLFIYIELVNTIEEKIKKVEFNERGIISYSFVKRYLFKNMYEKTFLQKDLFYVIYQIYFLLHTIKYNFFNFLREYLEIKRNIGLNLERFLKLKLQNDKKMPGEEVEEGDEEEEEDDAEDAVEAEDVEEVQKGKEYDETDDLNRCDDKDDDTTRKENAETRKRKKKGEKETGEMETVKRDARKKEMMQREADEKGSDAEKWINKGENNQCIKTDIEEESSDALYFSADEQKRKETPVANATECFGKAEEEGNIYYDKVQMEKVRIINFFQKNYPILKYFEANTEETLEECCAEGPFENFCLKEKSKLRKGSIICSVGGVSTTGKGSTCTSMRDSTCASVRGNTCTNDGDRFVRKLNSFFKDNSEVNGVINDLFVYNKDNVYSKILKNNLLIVKELRKIRMDVLYPIFNASLVFLFDDFYFFIIQNIKLVIEEKEKTYSNHKIFLNLSFILLHTFAKDVKIEKYMVSIFYILKLCLNKLKSLKIVDQIGNSYIWDIYNKKEKIFEKNIKYYNMRKDKHIVKDDSSEEEGDDNTYDSLILIDTKDIKINTNYENRHTFIHIAEEKIKLHQNVFYIFLKLLQNVLKANNLYYNFKFIIYDILFSEYSNKGIIYACMKCILDKRKLEEVFNYCISMLDCITGEQCGLSQQVTRDGKSGTLPIGKKVHVTNRKISEEIVAEENSLECIHSDEIQAKQAISLLETTFQKGSYISCILHSKELFKITLFDSKHSISSKVSSLYINLVILYYIFRQKGKNNRKSKLYDNCLKLDVEDYYNIVNKLLPIFYHINSLNTYYDRYIKHICLKILKKIYNLFSLKEAQLYMKHFRNNSKEETIYKDKKIGNIQHAKGELISFFESILNNEIRNYFRKNNVYKITSEEYKFFFFNNLNCNKFILKNENFLFMVNCLVFLFTCKYDKITFYKIIFLILMERNENKNYLLAKIISTLLKTFKLKNVFSNVKKLNRKNKIRLPKDLANHSILLYIIRTAVILFLLIDYSAVYKQTVMIDDYLSYSVFRKLSIKKKTLNYYYTQLSILLYRIFYNERNLPYFFKIFFSTLYIISFKKRYENGTYLFERVFHLKGEGEEENAGEVEDEGKEEGVREEENIGEGEDCKENCANIQSVEAKCGKRSVTSRSRDIKRKHVMDENSEDAEKSNSCDYIKKNYREILRSHRQMTKRLSSECEEKNKNGEKASAREYIKIDDSSSSSSSSDSDVSYKVHIKSAKGKPKGKALGNYSNKSSNKSSDKGSAKDSSKSCEGETKRKASSLSSSSTTTGKDEYDASNKPDQQLQQQKQQENVREHVKNGDEAEGKNKLGENFHFNGSLSLKILNHFIFLCKGFHKDLELKIYNGIVSSLKENINDKEKLKTLLNITFSDEDKHSIKYKKKMELLNIIETKIIFLNYIKENLKKRKSLITRMSELNLHIFKNNCMFNIELDFI
ncbi:conserved Plasmodium protein, unknown function [Plasmodium ovale]|uniref:Uncharacterized protein n=1 Tax=Plasmodium ovale TaxID=36330 RepID=A0A1D3TGR2_PLAOA|nr:conserved Plasmodium protein, unknown function [Plasmodium ovale]